MPPAIWHFPAYDLPEDPTIRCVYVLQMTIAMGFTLFRACVYVLASVHARAVHTPEVGAIFMYHQLNSLLFRFNKLFKVRERWAQEDLEPYIR